MLVAKTVCITQFNREGTLCTKTCFAKACEGRCVGMLPVYRPRTHQKEQCSYDLQRPATPEETDKERLEEEALGDLQ